MSFRNKLSQIWNNVQFTLFPQLENDLGELSKKHKKLISVLELIRIEEFIPCSKFNYGRPIKDRSRIARAFIAKIVFKLHYTKQLVEQLKIDKQLRSICGWESKHKIPHESTFSRAFREFSESSLPDEVHQYLVKNLYEGEIVGHLVTDTTPIEVREKAIKKGSAKNVKEKETEYIDGKKKGN